MAQSLDTPVLLAVVRPITNDDTPKKLKNSKTKTRAGAAHGLIEGEKQQMFDGIRPSKRYYNNKGYDEGNGGKGGSCGKRVIVQKSYPMNHLQGE